MRRRSQSPLRIQRLDCLGEEVRWRSQSPCGDVRMSDSQTDMNDNKGPTVHLIESNANNPQVFHFDRSDSHSGANPDDIVVVRRASSTCSQDAVTPCVVGKAALLVAILMTAAYVLNWYSMNYSKSSEVLALSLLLLLHVYVFEPKNFLLSVIFNRFNSDPAPVCRRPSYHTQ